MTARLLSALLLAVGLAGPAAAQEPRLETRLPPAARTAVEAVLRDAEHANLPTEPLVQRALEGASRNAGPERIVEAVRDLAERLGRAHAALGPTAAEAELLAAAGALNLGYAEADLERFRRTARGEPLTLPLLTLADLLQRGVPRDAADSAILALLAARVPDESYGRFRRSVAADIGRGIAPSSAAHARSQGVLRERRPAPHGRVPAIPRPTGRGRGGPR